MATIYLFPNPAVFLISLYILIAANLTQVYRCIGFSACCDKRDQWQTTIMYVNLFGFFRRINSISVT